MSGPLGGGGSLGELPSDIAGSEPQTGADKGGGMNRVPDSGVLKAPFPWFGGKSRVAAAVWKRLGNPKNYVEPFAGSLAVLLGRRTLGGTETVNDLDCMVANFWRALQHDPDAVADAADWPVNEADQHARHQWLVNRAEFRERMKTDPDYYDSKIAGWWVWGQSIWIGSGWCKLPHLSNAGMGVNRQLPHLGNAGMGDYFACLAARLRNVRVCCGDWSRVLGPSVTSKHGITAIFLDPPYADDADRRDGLYSADDLTVAHSVRAWALEYGNDSLLRIALCGYEGIEMPEEWTCLKWKAPGGYGSQGNGAGRANSSRERIWFSPHCLGREPLFEGLGADLEITV